MQEQQGKPVIIITTNLKKPEHEEKQLSALINNNNNNQPVTDNIDRPNKLNKQQAKAAAQITLFNQFRAYGKHFKKERASALTNQVISYAFPAGPPGFQPKLPGADRLELIENIKSLCLLDKLTLLVVEAVNIWSKNSNCYPKLDVFLAALKQPSEYFEVKIRNKWLENNKQKKILDNGHVLFKSLKSLLTNLGKIIATLKKSNGPEELIAKISEIEKLYTTYFESVCCASFEDQALLTQPMVKVFGMEIGHRLLPREIAYEILKRDKLGNKQPNLGNSTHKVSQVGGNFYKLNYCDNSAVNNSFLLEPMNDASLNIKPGIDHAVSSFYNVLSGQGTTPTTLLKISLDQETYYVQASKAAGKEDFSTYLERFYQQKETHQSFQMLPIRNFSTAFITSLIVRFADGKPDNYVVEYIQDDSGNLIAMDIINVDADRAFTESFYRETYLNKDNQTVFEYCLSLSDVIYCLPQMDLPLDPDFCQHFLSFSPEKILFNWLKMIVQQDGCYRQWQKEKIFNADEMKILGLPVQFRPREIGRIYQRIKSIQHAVRKNPHITPRELFKLIDPLAKRIYDTVLQDHQQNIIKTMEIFSRGYSVTKNLEKSLSPEEHGILNRVTTNGPEAYILERSQDIYTALERFLLLEIDFGDLDFLNQQLVLDYLRDFHLLRYLHLSNCSALNNEYLVNLHQRYPFLEKLSIIDCKNVTKEGLLLVLYSARPLTLQISHDQMDVESLCNLYYHCQQQGHILELRLPSDLELVIDPKKYPNLLNNILDQEGGSIPEEKPELIQFLIDQGAAVNSRDSYGRTPLHLAAKRGHLKIVTMLLQAGANINALDYKRLDKQTEESPLDKAFFYRNPLVVLFLLDQGAYCRRSLDEIIDVCSRSLEKTPNKELSAKFFNFLLKNNLLSDNNIEKYVSYAEGVKSLTLTDVTLSNDSLRYLLSHCQQLQQLDISDLSLIHKDAFDIIKNVAHINLSYEQVVAFKLLKYDQYTSLGGFYYGNSLIAVTSLRLRLISSGNLNFAKLFQTLAYVDTFVQLDLSDCELQKTTIESLAKFLQKTTSLKKLILSGCKINHDILDILIAGLKNNKTIEVIELCRSQCNTAALLKGLSKHPNLKQLLLNLSLVDDNTSESLAKFLTETPILQQLFLKHCELTNKAVIALSTGLEKNTTLRVLDIRNNKRITANNNSMQPDVLSEQGISILCKALFSHPCIRALALPGTLINKEVQMIINTLKEKQAYLIVIGNERFSDLSKTPLLAGGPPRGSESPLIRIRNHYAKLVPTVFHADHNNNVNHDSSQSDQMNRPKLS